MQFHNRRYSTHLRSSLCDTPNHAFSNFSWASSTKSFHFFSLFPLSSSAAFSSTRHLFYKCTVYQLFRNFQHLICSDRDREVMVWSQVCLDEKERGLNGPLSLLSPPLTISSIASRVLSSYASPTHRTTRSEDSSIIWHHYLVPSFRNVIRFSRNNGTP